MYFHWKKQCKSFNFCTSDTNMNKKLPTQIKRVNLSNIYFWVLNNTKFLQDRLNKPGKLFKDFALFMVEVCTVFLR